MPRGFPFVGFVKNYRPWTPEEIETLKREYSNRPIEEIANLLSRTKGAIIRKAWDLDLMGMGGYQGNWWGNEEIEILRKFYRTAPKQKLLDLLPKRTWEGIVNKSRELGLRRQRITRPLKELELTEAQRGYLAGLIDGEGSLIFKKLPNRYGLAPKLDITNTYPEVLKWCKEILKMGSVQCTCQGSKRHKPVYHFRIYRNSELITLLREIVPYMIIKRRRAEELLKLLEIQRFKDF